MNEWIIKQTKKNNSYTLTHVATMLVRLVSLNSHALAFTHGSECCRSRTDNQGLCHPWPDHQRHCHPRPELQLDHLQSTGQQLWAALHTLQSFQIQDPTIEDHHIAWNTSHKCFAPPLRKEDELHALINQVGQILCDDNVFLGPQFHQDCWQGGALAKCQHQSGAWQKSSSDCKPSKHWEAPKSTCNKPQKGPVRIPHRVHESCWAMLSQQQRRRDAREL